MRLLSPNQTKDLEGEEVTRQILRAKESQEMATKWHKRLADAEADFAHSTARQQKEWAEMEKEHEVRLKEMAVEIESLESRKTQALIPIEIYKKQAQDLMDSAQAREEAAKKQEDDAERTKDILEDKLDDVSDREIAAEEKERKLLTREQGIAQQSEEVRQGSARLSEAMENFKAYCAVEESKLRQKRKENGLKEANLEAREDKITRETDALKIFATRLTDERETLGRAWKELEAKGGKYPNGN